jgi:hypothetical protein
MNRDSIKFPPQPIGLSEKEKEKLKKLFGRRVWVR